MQTMKTLQILTWYGGRIQNRESGFFCGRGVFAIYQAIVPKRVKQGGAPREESQAN